MVVETLLATKLLEDDRRLGSRGPGRRSARPCAAPGPRNATSSRYNAMSSAPSAVHGPISDIAVSAAMNSRLADYSTPPRPGWPVDEITECANFPL